ncbi:MAG: T9SS type A sorting domain-containing protein [Elusimicrobiota bacterium]
MTGKILCFGRLPCRGHDPCLPAGRRRRHSFAGFSVFCLLIAACGATLRAVLTGGALKIPALSTTSGGGVSANGATELDAANIGGLTASGTRLTGGNMSITAGAVPAVVTFATAKNNLKTAHCYPVPFKPSAGHTGITFTGLTRAARIRIYTISGELVRTLDKADAGETLDWNARNSRGAAVDSGVYLWLIESATQKKKGKLMIIR